MDVRTLKDRAHQLDRVGKHSKALKVYETLIGLVPSDPALRLRHADSCRKAGFIAPALKSYLSAARLMLTAGQTARARAVVRAAHHLSPSNLEVSQALDALERRMRPARNIREALESAAELTIEVGEAVPLFDAPGSVADATRAGFHSVVDPFELVWLCPDMASIQLASGTWVTVSADGPLKIEATGTPMATAGASARRASRADA